MLQTIINAFYLTIELWIFCAILLTALTVEAIINKVKQRSELCITLQQIQSQKATSSLRLR